MRTRFTVFFVVMVLCITCYGAVYVKGNHHFDSYYSYGTINPESDQINQWWFNKGKVSFITPDWRLTLDKQEKRIIVVNRREKNYTEIPLPVKPSSHLEQSLTDMLNDYQLDGTITAMGEKETINQKVCNSYKINEWIIYQKNRFYDRDRTVKITCDVPFDWQLLEELHQWVRSYFSPQKSYLSQLKKLKGFVWASQEVQINRGKEIKWNFRVVEISSKQPPGDTFTIPKDYKKKDKLSREDIICIRGTLYIFP